MTESGRRLARPGVWTWLSVLGSVVLCGLLSWIHLEQRIVVERTARFVNSFRLSRLDLTKGFLHMRLAEREADESARQDALALLLRALDDLQPEKGPDADGKLDFAESAGRTSFEAALSTFRKELEKAASGTAHGAEEDARLSLRFQELEGKADLLDDLHQKDLRALRARLDREFAITLGIAALLLGAACLGVWIAGRAGARATAALRKSEERFRSVIATLSHGVLISDRTGGDLVWNPAALAMHGFSDPYTPRDSLRGLGEMFELFTLSGAAVPLEAWPISRVLRGETLRDVELRVFRTDTSWQRVFSYSGGVLSGVSGGPLAVLSIADVTERKRAEEDLQRQQAELRVLFDLIPALIWFKDTENGILRVNQRVADAAGRTVAEIEGRPSAEIYPLDADKYYADDLDVIRSGQPKIGFVEKLHGPGGEALWVQTDKVPYFDASGQVIGIVVAAQDITERKRSEDALREERERLNQLAATAPGVIHSFRIAPDGRSSFPYASPRFEEVYGLSPEAVREDGGALEALWHPDDAERIRTSIEVSRRDLTPWREVFRIRHSQKGEIWIEGHTIPVRDPDGGTTWHGSLLDVTLRKKLEEQLRQAQKMEGIGQLASGVAHDFNNLLTVILGNAALLPEGEAEGPVREIIEAAERAAALTRQLLLFSRKQVIQAVDLDLNEVVGGMTRMLERILGEDVALGTDLAKDLQLVNADAGMLEQVLLNLAVNARDAMPRGGRLDISTRLEVLDEAGARGNPEAVPGTFVCLSASDSGCGIPPEVLTHIFEPFFTTKEVGKGTGLGLATVHGIVKQHRGWIVTTSLTGAGTTFEIYLPGVSGSLPARAPAGKTHGMPRGKETILVVEDEPPLRNLVKAILTSCGYSVRLAESGVRALEVWKEHGEGVDLLLTDMVMPDGMSGKELAEAVHRDRPGLPVVFTSGYSPELGGQGLALVEGVNFIQKPYAPKKLADLIRRRLDGPRA